MNNPGTGTPGTDKGVADAAGDVATDLKAQAKDVADTVTAQASGYADQARDAVADEVKTVSSALRSAAKEMSSGSASERTFSQIADGLADASEAMRDKDLGQIVHTLNDFAKRNPMVFLGSAALLGFAATRFAKASGHSVSHNSTSGDQRNDNQGRTSAQPYGTRAQPYGSQTPRTNTGAPQTGTSGSGMASPAINRPSQGDRT